MEPTLLTKKVAVFLHFGIRKSGNEVAPSFFQILLINCAWYLFDESPRVELMPGIGQDIHGIFPGSERTDQELFHTVFGDGAVIVSQGFDVGQPFGIGRPHESPYLYIPVAGTGCDFLGNAVAALALLAGRGDSDGFERFEGGRAGGRFFGEPAAADPDAVAVVGFGEGGDLDPLLFIGGVLEFPVAYINADMGNLPGFAWCCVKEDQIPVFQVSYGNFFAYSCLFPGDTGNSLHVHAGVAVVDQPRAVEGIRPLFRPDVGLAQLSAQKFREGKTVRLSVTDGGFVDCIVILAAASGHKEQNT